LLKIETTRASAVDIGLKGDPGNRLADDIGGNAAVVLDGFGELLFVRKPVSRGAARR
jgi:hypothetical protein